MNIKDQITSESVKWNIMSDAETQIWESLASDISAIDNIFDKIETQNCSITDFPNHLKITAESAESILSGVKKIKITNDNKSIINELERLNFMILKIYSTGRNYSNPRNSCNYSNPGRNLWQLRKKYEAISLKLPAVSNQIRSIHSFILQHFFDPQKTFSLVMLAHQIDEKTTLKAFPKDTIEKILIFWLQHTASKFQGCIKDVMRAVNGRNIK